MSSDVILVVEDNPVNQRVAQLMLRRIGYDSVIAENGEVATRLLRERAFPLVLMDAHMPVMNGLETTRWIRSELPEERQPKIVVMTASLFSDAKGDWESMGVDGWAEKPMKLNAFEELIAEVLSGCSAPSVLK